MTDADLASLESELGITLPAAYRAFLRHVHFVKLNGPGIRFAAHPPSWQAALRRAQSIELFAPDGVTLAPVHELGLFVIGDDDNDGGPVWVDLRDRDALGDCPVVFVEHENGERFTLFSSTARMFDCLAFSAETELQLDDSGVDRRDLVLRFLALDPEGAGGPAREWWESYFQLG